MPPVPAGGKFKNRNRPMSNSSTNKLRQTTLFSTHVALGGNMVDFGGWEMPLWYSTGAIKEHMAVIRAAGLFDTSHMSVVLAKGETARGFLNYALTRDISGQRLERCGYSAILTEEGFCLDDTIIYPLAAVSPDDNTPCLGWTPSDARPRLRVFRAVQDPP